MDSNNCFGPRQPPEVITDAETHLFCKKREAINNTHLTQSNIIPVILPNMATQKQCSIYTCTHNAIQYLWCTLSNTLGLPKIEMCRPLWQISYSGKMEHTRLLYSDAYTCFVLEWICWYVINLNLDSIGINKDEYIIIENKCTSFLCVKVYILILYYIRLFATF